jgi:hypothetical protein
MFGARWKKEILEPLQPGSKEVLNLDKEFAQISLFKELICFYETKETLKIGLVRDCLCSISLRKESSQRVLDRH